MAHDSNNKHEPEKGKRNIVYTIHLTHGMWDNNRNMTFDDIENFKARVVELIDAGFYNFTVSVEPSKEASDIDILLAKANPVHFTKKFEPHASTCEGEHNWRDDMAACPNCGTNANLSVKSDLVSLNALEYWVVCEGCHEEWTDRILGCDYAESVEEIVKLWNCKFGNQES